MFIKFGDKTKRLFVKKSKKNKDEEEENVVYLDDHTGDRRAEILNSQISNESEEEKSEDK